jgi:hypothetical protein
LVNVWNYFKQEVSRHWTSKTPAGNSVFKYVRFQTPGVRIHTVLKKINLHMPLKINNLLNGINFGTGPSYPKSVLRWLQATVFQKYYLHFYDQKLYICLLEKSDEA